MDFENVTVNKDISIIFMGTPDFAVPILEGLIDHYHVRAIVTQPDKKSGRDGEIVYSPVKQVALKHTILTLQPDNIKEAYQEILDLRADLIITCAYGQIIPSIILESPRLGCINVHASLLPKLRGGAPIHHAIIDGYQKTGITIMYMNSKMDQGDIISQREIPIENTDTASTLHDKLMYLGKELLLETLPSIINGTNKREKQNHTEATYAFTIKREDEKLDFSQTRRQVYNKVRGLNSYPGAYLILDDKIVKVWECYMSPNTFPEAFDGQITGLYKDGIGIKTSNGEVVLTVIQPEGKKKMLATDFVNGVANKKSLIGKIVE